MPMLEPDYREALEACLEGRFTEELRALYQMLAGARVPWVLFPNWGEVPMIPSREDTRVEASSLAPGTFTDDEHRNVKTGDKRPADYSGENP